jgi:hypothetical protein
VTTPGRASPGRPPYLKQRRYTMPLYQVTIDVEFRVKATSRDVVGNRIRKMLRDAKFDEKDFEWSIQPIKERKEDINNDNGL